MKVKPLPSRAGFSLIELLAVMVIMAILCVATLPALESLLQASAITQGGQAVAGKINLARQMASARNMTVQVRLIELAQVKNTAATGFNAIQLWSSSTDATPAVPLDHITILPDEVVISQDTVTYSPLLPVTGPGGTGNVIGHLAQMPVANGQAYYAWFNVMPSGLLALSGPSTAASQGSLMSSLYLSLVPASLGAAATAPSMTSTPTPGAPRDYLVVQINPGTGSTLVYQP